MGRMDRLSKKISEAELNEILNEMKEINEAKRIDFTKDGTYLLVETSEENYQNVMGKAVNICSRVANGLEISFAGFEPEIV